MTDNGGQTSSSELKPGDKILLEAGVKIPSSVKLAAASDFYISESAITGESDIFEKLTGDVCRAGSIVVGGKAEGIVEKQKNEERNFFLLQSIKTNPLTEGLLPLQRFFFGLQLF